MKNKLQFIFTTAMVLMLFIVSCTPQPAPSPTTPVEVPEAPEQVDTTGEAPVDAVGEDILDSLDTDEELDSSELDDIDNILSDIENI
jgi:hypothetical protein